MDLVNLFGKKAMHVSTIHLWETNVNNLGSQKSCLTQVDSNMSDDVMDNIASISC